MKGSINVNAKTARQNERTPPLVSMGQACNWGALAKNPLVLQRRAATMINPMPWIGSETEEPFSGFCVEEDWGDSRDSKWILPYFL